jgi:hypothetical protein
MIISTQQDSNSMAACTGRLMHSIVYYMVMGALGRHQFAHIPDSRITRLQFGIFMALTSIPISMNCNLSPADAIVNSFSRQSDGSNSPHLPRPFPVSIFC